MNVLTPVLTDQMVIQEIIEKEANYFAQGNYENWAACMLKTPLTYYARTASFNGQDSEIEAFGWEEISQKIRQEMSSLSENTLYSQVKNDFRFNILEDMAFVDFSLENGKKGSCVLEKNNGEWLILRMSL